MEEPQDKEDIRALVEYLYRQASRYVDYYGKQQEYTKHYQYVLDLCNDELGSLRMYIGKRNDQPFAVFGNQLIEISDEAYTQLLPWLERQYKRCSHRFR